MQKYSILFAQTFHVLSCLLVGLGLPLFSFGAEVDAYRKALSLIDRNTLSNRLEAHGLRAFKGNLQSMTDDKLLWVLKAVHTGVLNPERMSQDIKYKKKDFIAADQLAAHVLRVKGDFGKLIDALAPQNSMYQSLLAARARFKESCSNQQSQAIAFKTLGLGASETNLSAIKSKFHTYGYLKSNGSLTVDSDFVRAINDIQATLKMDPDGSMSQTGRTFKYLSKPCAQRIAQIDADLEKLRWLPSELEKKHIFVNTAFSSFWYQDLNGPVPVRLSFRAINGSFDRMTPSMKDKITHLVFNPTWTIPPTVFIKDKVKLLSSMRASQIQHYFQKNHYQVVSSDFTSVLSPLDIDWSYIDPANVDFYIQQKPNYLNSLGVVKFMMANPYAIYLHDTNQRDLFNRNDRMKSSGCVRLEKPLALAEILLAGTQWDLQAIQDHVVKPGEVLDEETRVNLKNPVPVYLLPLTTQLSKEGVLRFTEDVYGHNQIILEKMNELAGRSQ